MIGRIGLLGGECTGKSALASQLEQALGACVVREQLRAFVDLQGRAPFQREQAHLMQQQLAAEVAASSACTADWLVCDPAPLITAVYSETYFADSSLTGAGVEHARGYDVLLWCDDDIPWVADGVQRDGPEFRSREHAVIERILRESGLSATLVSGSVEQRVHTALARCAEITPR